MSMSTHVVGIKPPDKRWKEMKAIFDACEMANVKVPDEVMKYFENDVPDDQGVVVNLEKHESHCVHEYEHGSSEGIQIDLKLLPPDITIIRFYNSW